MHAVKKVLDKVLAAVCVLLFTVLVLTVSWQVFSRQVLSNPSEWSGAFARYVFVWLGMFGAALVFSERGHIAVDVVVRKLPERVQRVVAVLVQLTIIVFAAVTLVWGGRRASQLAWDQNVPGMPIPIGVGPLYLVMPITGVIIMFYAVHHVIAVLRHAEATVEVDDTAEAL
ncbi:TRAP transporter small permease [Haloactinomyces albus]|uniref:TRAP-type C4-dicarboxylate transport system permease small subunit n=1 Tax=Haloactinomyces albus TaxID=1352928 RepID=A0AAE3ZG77_9ACTN|nr:TRAP transporter small permease [Haloactinomyces albus]MDR7304341.1 TRAP-type C4-dicarboxylate transport system permease small subunit [Haloactinomyces albus]